MSDGRELDEADLIARVYVALREPDQAMVWLTKGFEERAAKMVLIGVDPRFDGIRNDSRFRDLVRRLKLPDDGR